MRILFFIDCFVSGGKERRLTELMKALKNRPEIKFELAVMDKEIHYKEILDLGINVHYLIRKTKKDLSVFKELYKLCKNIKPDILHCWDSMTAVYSVPVCKLLHIKLVNGMITDSPAKRNIFNKRWLRARLTFPFSDVVVGNSIAGLKAYRVARHRSICIYNGFNFERINKVEKNCLVREQMKVNTKYIVGMVASFALNKDYKTYFKAAQLILDKRNDITFLAIGKNTDSDESKDLIPEKYKEHIRLLGKISNVESVVNAMDIGVLSTFTEGISNSILEYMALGKPVIATDGGGTREILVDKETGFLITQSDPVELSGKLELLLNDTELRNSMGSAGKQRIQDLFSIDKMVGKYISTYEKLCLN